MELGLVSGTIADEDALKAELVDVGVDLAIGPPDAFVDRGYSALLVGGDAGLQSTFRTGPTAPVLPVDASVGVEPVDRSAVVDAVAAIERGDAETISRPTVRAELGDGRALHGLFDVGAMTTAPAAISEFSITANDREIGRFRADGVVAVTPPGSVTYGAAAGGPILAPTISAVAVVPVSPFMTQSHVWVLDEFPIRINVTRDESPVGLSVDDRAAGRLHAGDAATISLSGTFDTLRVPQSRSPYIRG